VSPRKRRPAARAGGSRDPHPERRSNAASASIGGEPDQGRRTAVSRADLVRLAVALDDAELARLAQGLGYRAVEPPKRPSPEVSGTDAMAPGAAPVVPASAIRQHRAYYLTERHQLTPPPRRDAPPAPKLDSSPPEPLPQTPPLVPWSRLWPLLRAALSELAERQRVDVLRLVAAQARLHPLRRLPRLNAPRWAPAGQLLLDLSPRLYPFWGDFAAIKRVVPRLRGRTGLEILALEQGPEGSVRAWDGEDWSVPRPYRAPAADVPVLILGDLGCLGAAAERQAWERLGRQFRVNGRQTVVLTPCPSRWWDPELAGLYFPVVLDRAAHIPARPAGARPWPAQAVDPQDALQHDPGARRLLALLDACLAISPALLRHLRHWLAAGCADVGSEAAAWQHPARQAGAFALLPGPPDESEQLQRAHSDSLRADERQRAWDLILAQQQAQQSSRAVRMEERIRQAAVLGAPDPQAEDFQDEVAKALETARGQEDWAQEQFLTGWIGRLGARMTPNAWDYSPRSEALWVAANPRATTDGAVLPSGLDIHRALAAQRGTGQAQIWRIVQRGEWLEIASEIAPEAPFLSGSPVAGRVFSADPVAQVHENRPDAPALSLPLRELGRLPLNEHGWRIRTEHEELVIAPLDRPAWAHTLGSDRDGLFVGFDDGYGARCAYWCGPGAPDWPSRREYSASVFSEPLARGFFLDDEQFRSLGRQTLALPFGSQSLGSDAYGIRATLWFKSAIIDLRWIWPGEFLMGSPKSEEGRLANETLHQVILTRGFWLAETACTQTLWEAVMGKNPSYREDAECPVENVSWDDVQRFLERLNAELVARQSAEASSPRFRLPTEAEWEYACRAGTTRAYSFGDTFDSERANSGSAAVKVRSLPPNPWGLYEMHGNVWEWCQDWYGDYPEGPVVDPAGPATGVLRVLRGGSWFDVAHSLRSAYRYPSDPGHRLHYDGFRLALGPELGQAGESKPARSETGQTAQGASGSERKAGAVGSRGASGKRAP